jgi:hypothetical protein
LPPSRRGLTVLFFSRRILAADFSANFSVARCAELKTILPAQFFRHARDFRFAGKTAPIIHYFY